MRFLADESCDFAVVRALRGAGHEVVAVRDTMPGATDEAVIEWALRDSRILITEDKDFGRLVFAGAAASPGVIYVRFPANAREAMAQTMVQLVATNAHKIPGSFIIVQPGRIRIAERKREK
jgi:predicted nuclease of predicted toxin-antitoxin system